MSTLAAALELAGAGLPVFPCKLGPPPAPGKSRSKKPYTKHGFKDATTDPTVIRGWWQKWPDALVAVPTGRASRLLVIDIDPEGAEWHRSHDPELRCARVHRTQRGHHFIYRMPEADVGCSVGQVAPGVDVRGEGGYVVWWPCHGLPAIGDMTDIGEPPGWLLERMLNGAAQAEPRERARPGAKIRAGRRNQYISDRGYALRKQGLSGDALEAALQALNTYCEPPLPEDEVLAIAWGKARVEPDAIPESAIELRPGELPRIVRDGTRALRDAGVQIFDRGGALYRPVRVEAYTARGGIERHAGSVVLRPVDETWMRLMLAHAASWSKYDVRAKRMKAADPPAALAQIIAGVPDAGGWPPLRGVVSHPLLMPDGTIIATRGYDERISVLLEFDGEWPIAQAPTREDAMAAVARLKVWLRNFPWAGDVDRSVALSLLLTAIARPALDTAPMHCVDSPEPGSGKSLLVDAAAVVATGARAPVMDFGRDDAEAGKRLDAMLLAGDPLIAIDNIERPLEGSALCQTLSQLYRRIRPLGSSTVVTVNCTALVTATGCNLTLRGDIVRRAIICRLDAGTDRPETRRIEQDLLGEAAERRAELGADIIVAMRAYALAGRPDVGVTPLGGYEGWSRMVRSVLIWAGEPDPCASMDRIRGDDPSRQAVEAVFRAWRQAYGDDYATAAEAVERAGRDEGLREALMLVAYRRDALDTRALQYWLRAHRDKRIGRLVLRGGAGHAGVLRWGVCGDHGDYGDHISNPSREIWQGERMPNNSIELGTSSSSPPWSPSPPPSTVGVTKKADQAETSPPSPPSPPNEEAPKKAEGAETSPASPAPQADDRTCPRCNGEGCACCGDIGRLVDIEAAPLPGRPSLYGPADDEEEEEGGP